MPRSARGDAAPPRAAWGSLSREQVVAAATDVVASRGYEQLTIRGLARDLGVSPMALYRHVRDKDDLLTDVVDRLLRTAWRPRTATERRREWLIEAADRLRRFLVNQPAALHVYLRRPAVSPSARTRMRAMLAVLEELTGDACGAHEAYAVLQTYTIGFAALEVSRTGAELGAEVPEALAEELAAYTSPHQFAQGLGYLLDGMQQRFGDPPSRPA